VSGNLELIDIDNKLNNMDTLYPEFLSRPGVKEIINNCVIEKSTNGGKHIYFRCDEIQGNQKLALCPSDKNDKNGKPIYETVFETRGEGGYVVCARLSGII